MIKKLVQRYAHFLHVLIPVFRKILPLLECLCLYVSLSVYAIILYSVYDSFFMINLYVGTFTALFFTSVSFEGLNIVSTPINVK